MTSNRKLPADERAPLLSHVGSLTRRGLTAAALLSAIALGSVPVAAVASAAPDASTSAEEANNIGKLSFSMWSKDTKLAVGDTARITFIVTNAGNVALGSVGIAGAESLTNVSCSQPVEFVMNQWRASTVIEPGQRFICSGDYAVQDDDLVTDSLGDVRVSVPFTAVGKIVDGVENGADPLPVSRDFGAYGITDTYQPPAPYMGEFSITASSDPSSFRVGEPVDVTFTVTNTTALGTPKRDFSITAYENAPRGSLPRISDVTCSDGTQVENGHGGATGVSPGESFSCTGTLIPTASDFEAGYVQLSFLALGTNPEANGDKPLVPALTNLYMFADRTPEPTPTTQPAGLTTRAVSTVDAGGEAYDVATLTGDIPDGAYLMFDIYRWGSQPQRPAKPYFTGTERVYVSSTGAGGAMTFESPRHGFTEPGSYQWFATLYSADGDVLAEDQWGVQSERTEVKLAPTPEPSETSQHPTLVTRAMSPLDVDDPGTDTATITGEVPEGAYLLFDIYRWEGQATRPDAPHHLGYQRVPVTGPGAYESPEFWFTIAGQYQWFATLYAEDGTVLAEDQWGAVPERTVVGSVPTPTPTPTTEPTPTPTTEPTTEPTPTPTTEPTTEPTPTPTTEPTTEPTPTPTTQPTKSPEPTVTPSAEPTAVPTATAIPHVTPSKSDDPKLAATGSDGVLAVAVGGIGALLIATGAAARIAARRKNS